MINMIRVLALFFLIFGSQVFAQLPPLIDRDLFLGDPEIAGMQISPDGNYISFLNHSTTSLIFG